MHFASRAKSLVSSSQVLIDCHLLKIANSFYDLCVKKIGITLASNFADAPGFNGQEKKTSCFSYTCSYNVVIGFSLTLIHLSMQELLESVEDENEPL